MLCPECYHDVPGGEGCPFCGAAPAAPAEGVSGVGAEPGDAGRAKSCPWEQRSSLGLLGAFGETIQSSLFRPGEFFRRMPPAGRKWSALLYAVVVGTLAWIVAMLWKGAVVVGPLLENSSWQEPATTGVFWIVTFVLIPPLVVVGTLFQSAILHVSLTLLNGARENYEATLKAVSYAATASLFLVFPFVGTPLAFFWRIALLVIGMREVHRISTGRAFLALLLPFVIVGTLLAAAFAFAIWMAIRLWPEMGDIIPV
jgi:hypothetical protein